MSEHTENSPRDGRALPELLSPAGSAESLRAALAAGADAVYFGGTSFSNRMRAKNFGDDELSEAIKLCHSVGAAAHITINTRVRDRELDDVLHLADVLLSDPDTAPDALIVADFGIAGEIHRRYPNVHLHASTQTSLCSPADCAVLAKMGFTRLVVPRELSRDEIRALCDTSEIEIEMFLHGAHCVSCSGQCLLSYMMGGRSGNRGECAQPCRLPFSVVGDGVKKQTNPDALSLADMCLAGRIPEVIDTGVRSLKLEGRLKSPAYVYGTTRIYRRLLDERRSATKEEVAELARLFSRGFTDGYFTHNYSKMSSVRVSGDAERAVSSAEIRTALNERIEKYAKNQPCRALSAELFLEKGCPARLTLSLRDEAELSVTVTGDIPQSATGAPVTCESAAKNLVKLGGTGYSLSADDIEFHIDDGLWYAVSGINELRRRAVTSLSEKIESAKSEKAEREVVYSTEEALVGRETDKKEGRAISANRTIQTAELADVRVLVEKSTARMLSEYFDTLYVPWHSYEKARAYLAVSEAEAETKTELASVMPVYTPNDEITKKRLSALATAGCGRILCHTVGQAVLAMNAGMTADVSFRANITNTGAYNVYRELGCDRIILSPELPSGAVSAIGGGAVVYGRLPLMVLSRCVICGGKCPHGNAGGRDTEVRRARECVCGAVLRDRRGEEFPIIGDSAGDCVNVVYNSVPTWMADRPDVLKTISHRHFMFSTEKSDEIADVISDHKAHSSRDNVRRM